MDEIIVRKYSDSDISSIINIWNEVVEDGVAFPQEQCLDMLSGSEFFGSQSYCGVAQNTESGEILGMYILHPNNVGRCGHIANASYAVSKRSRGLHIGEKLVSDSLTQAKKLNFKIMQFNAVVVGNTHARHLYERLGFVHAGTIPNGFYLKNKEFSDICIYYKEL